MRCKKWVIAATTGFFVAAGFLIFKVHAILDEFIPVLCYFAIPHNYTVLPYPKEHNFGGDGLWLETLKEKPMSLDEETTGFLWSPKGQRVEVSVLPGAGNVFLKFPTRPAKDTAIPGETLDLPVGLYYFSRLSVVMPDGRIKEYPIGHIWLEILPQERTEKWKEYYAEVVARIGYNPVVVVRFQNRSDKPVALTGIHLPKDFPYGVDSEYFSAEYKGSNSEDGQGRVTILYKQTPKDHEPLPLTKKVSSAAGDNFPNPITVESGDEVDIFFTLAAKMPKALNAFVAFNPVILRTAEGKYISSFTLPLLKGLPKGYGVEDLWRIFLMVLKNRS